MIKRTLSILSATLLAAGFVSAAAAGQAPERVEILANRSQADNNAAYLRYRAAVLGHQVDRTLDSTIVQRPAAGVVPGGYARYLIVNGENETAALARAAATGEQTVYRVVQSAPLRLTGVQLHEKYLAGSAVTPQRVDSAVAAAAAR